MTQSTYAIAIEGDKDDWQFKTLIYSESGRRLKLSLESPDGTGKNWMASPVEVSCWDGGQEIPAEDRSRIVGQIVEWGTQHGFVIMFSPGMSREQTVERYTSKGWRVIENPDGSITCSPPPKSSLTMANQNELPDLGKCFYCDHPATGEAKGALPLYLLPDLFRNIPPGLFHRTCTRCRHLELRLTGEKMRLLADKSDVNAAREMLECVKIEVQNLVNQ